MLSAGQQASAQAQDALAQLCQTYWYPLYVFIRRQGHTPEDAEDLVQGFFAKMIEKNFVSSADREKGRFRSFLLLALKRYVANEWERASRQKRGGANEIISLDTKNTEIRYQAESVDDQSPEKAFDRQWALTLLERVLHRLCAEFASSEKLALFEELKVFLSQEKGAAYAEIASRFGMTESAVKVRVHRLRRRYRELLRLEIAHTVSSPEAVDDEIRELFAALN